VVAVVAGTGILAILLALAVGLRDEVLEPTNERPVAGVAVTAISEAKAELVRREKPRTETLNMRFSFMDLPQS
jgi:hypothetical protein